jgi:hypothetical protein
MGRQIERNRGLRLAFEQFVQIFSEEHRQVSIGEDAIFPNPPTEPIVPDQPGAGASSLDLRLTAIIRSD